MLANASGCLPELLGFGRRRLNHAPLPRAKRLRRLH